MRPLAAAFGFTVSGCLFWACGAQLSVLGHAFTLAGAVVGVGLLSLGLSQLARYAVDSPNPVLADAARWLLGSRVRGFMLGAAIAFYGVLLRPLIYETLWFAAVYEWLAVLVVALLAMMRIRGSLKAFVDSAEAAPSTWTRWDRHQQFFEDRPDPRWDLVSRWRQRFVESGEWVSLWTYLMGLLYWNEAPPESVRAVFRPLRNCVAAPARFTLWGWGRNRNRRREAALAESLQSAERALAGAPSTPVAVDESALREAAGPFIESGSEPEAMAAVVIAAYRQRGADANHTVNLWLLLVNVVNRPSGGSSRRGFADAIGVRPRRADGGWWRARCRTSPVRETSPR